MVKLSYDSSSVFINATALVQINPSLEIEAMTQVIVCASTETDAVLTDVDLVYDLVEVIDIDKITYNGFKITDVDDIKAFIKFHKEMGMDIWSMLQDMVQPEIKKFTPAEYVEAFTEFKPKSKYIKFSNKQ